MMTAQTSRMNIQHPKIKNHAPKNIRTTLTSQKNQDPKTKQPNTKKQKHDFKETDSRFERKRFQRICRFS